MTNSVKYMGVVAIVLIAAAAHAAPPPTGVALGVPGGHTMTTGIPGAAPSGGGVPGSSVTGSGGIPGGQTNGSVPGGQTTSTDIPGSNTFIPPPVVPVPANTATTGATLGNIPAGSLSFQALNRSGNGYITPEQFTSAGLSMDLFRQMDTNNDGLISGAEYDAHPLNRPAQ